MTTGPLSPAHPPGRPTSGDSTRATYDRFAEAYADRYFETRALDAAMDGFLNLLPTHPTILDAGCGPGHQSRYFSSRGAYSIGLDFSEAMLTEGRRRDPDVSMVCGDMEAIPVAASSFDGVWARASLIHMDPDAAKRALLELRRALKSRGLLYAAVRAGTGETVRREIQEGIPMVRYFRFWTLGGWSDLLRESGFRTVAGGIESGDPEDWIWTIAAQSS